MLDLGSKVMREASVIVKVSHLILELKLLLQVDSLISYLEGM